MSLVSHNPNASIPHSVAPGAVAGPSTTATLASFQLGSPVPQSIFTTDASTRAWHAHLQKLDPKERDFFLRYATGSVESFSNFVQRICDKHRKQSRISKINDLLRPFVKTLGMYMPVASAASQADPYPSSLVIGGIMGLLQISDGFDLYQQQIMKWLSKLSAKAALLIEFDICIYQYDDEIQDALVLIYSDILDFCQKALKLYIDEEGNRRSGFVVFGKSLIERFSDTFGDIVDSFEIHLDSYKARAQLCDSKRLMQIYLIVVNSAMQNHEAHREIKDSLAAGRIEMQTRQLQAYEAQVSASQELRDASAQAQKDIIDSLLAGRSEAQAQADQRAAELKRAEDRAKKVAKKKLVIAWLPSVQLQDIHAKRIASVTTGTGAWFLSHAVFKNWKSSVDSDLLWVKGKPGCGKSRLAALTWDELKPRQNDRTAVACFYCDSSNLEQSSYVYLLTTLLKQISVQSSQLHHELEQMYDKESLIQDRGPGANEVEKLLPVVLSGFTQAFIIVDGLDELQEPQAFLRVLPLLLRDTTCVLRIIVFCRDYLPENLPIQSTLKNYPQLHVDQGANKEDIAVFISSKLSRDDDPDWNIELLDRAKTVLLDKADGMFLYVSLMVGRLRASLSENELNSRLESLPTGLTKAYEANFKRILNQEEEEDKSLTLNILLWIANARRPLSRMELLEALSIRQNTKKKDRGGTDRDFTTFCAELVYFDNDNFYHLVHTSLREYLLEAHSNTSAELKDYRAIQVHAERTLAEACLTYLLFDQFSAGPVDDLAQKLLEHPFLGYAAENWGSHVASAAEDTPADLAWEFIDNESARNLSMQVIMAEEGVYPFPGSSPLHILAHFGLYTFAEARSQLRAFKRQVDGFGMSPLDYAWKGGRAMCLWLLEDDEDSVSETAPIMARYSPYHVAVAFGWNDVLERLIAIGYNINHTSSNIERTPLAEAAAQGNEWAVNRLLEAKADVNAKDADGRNPLMIALDEPHQSLLHSLLQNGAEIDAQDNDGVSALHYAVDNGNLEATKALIERKPRLHMTGEKYSNQTPLHLAAEHDHDEIFKILHDYGADVESTCMAGFRPMHLAAFHNSLKVARLLIDLDAERNPHAEDEKTVLHVAAEYSGVEFVELILAVDPDVNAKEKEAQSTALHAAARVGSTAVCKLLLDKGADVDLPNDTKQTALHLAVINGHVETAKLLLDYGANPMKKAVFDSPVLHYAANEGNKEFVQPLIDAQADPEAPNIHGHRALHFAARKGHKDFVEQLFIAVTRLDVNALDIDGKTALHLAAAAGHLSTVRLLQEKGAEVNMQDSSRNLPIHYAAWDGHIQVVEMLISGANANFQGYSGRTVLNIGALRGHESIVRLMLDQNAMLELGDDDKSSALMNAVRMNHNTITHLLISKNADVHTMDGERRTLIHAAARNGDHELVKLLLDRHCDVHAKSNFGDTPFLDAVSSNSLTTIELLLDHGVDGSGSQNKIGTTPVHAAAEEGNLQMLVRLLNSGAKADLLDRIGRSALSVAATKGRHALVEPLLNLGLSVDGHESCYWTPLGTTCEAGYIRFANMLLQRGADIHRYAKHTKMTPLHHAAAMRRPRIIRKLVALGADIFSRDCYANSALDYASKHAPSFQAIKQYDSEYVALNLADRQARLWRNIRHELECLISLGEMLTVETELIRLLKISVLATSFLYLRDIDQYENVKYLYMELSFQAESADLQLSIACNICDTSLNRLDLWICNECHELYLCKRCHDDYKQGWKASNSAPEGVKELEKLEKQIEPLRQVMLPIIDEIRIQFIPSIFIFFTFVQTWADTKRKEYEAWETKFNDDGFYKFRKRPCQELLKLLEEGRLFMKTIEDKGLEFDEQREDCAALAKKFSDYHRTHNVLRDDDGFDCSGHDYLLVSKKEYDQVCLDRRIFRPDRRLADEWFRELLGKCPLAESQNEPAAELDGNLLGKTSNLIADLPEPTEPDTSSQTFEDELDVAEIAPATLQSAQGEKLSPKDENTRDKGHAPTKKPTEVPIHGRPKMPQGLGSSFALSIVPQTNAALEEQKPIVDNEAVIEELRSPTVAAATFSSLKGADDEASTRQISNAQRFTAELLDGHRSLKRRITSPKFDSEDPFETSSLKRRATAPFPSVQEPREWTVSHRFRDIHQPLASEATVANDCSSPYEKPSLNQEPSALTSIQETPAQATTEKPLKVTFSSTSNYGRFVMLAVTVAESVSPGFDDLFFSARLERGDLADFHLDFNIAIAKEQEPGESGAEARAPQGSKPSIYIDRNWRLWHT